MATSITINVDDGKVRLGLNNLATKLPTMMESEMTPIMEQAKFEASGGYSGGNSYTVPTVYGQIYERTGTLGRGIHVTRTNLKYQMESFASYSVSVLGNAAGAGQTRDFVGRWPNMAAVMAKWAAVAIERMRSKIDAMIIDFGL